MSMRQVRKLKKAAEPEEEVDDSPVVAPRKNLFKHLQASEDEAAESSESEVDKPVPKPKKAVARKKELKPVESDFDFDSLEPLAETETHESPEVSASIFSRDKSSMNPETEARRLFGTSKPQRRTMLRGRRFWLGIPLEAENWPFVRDNLKLEKVAGGFELVSSQEYDKELSLFVEILQSQDIQSMMEFVQRHPFHPHALLQVAEVFRQHSQFEQSFSMVRRALFSLECGFHFNFDPKIGPKLAGNSLFNPCLLKALTLYTQLLFGQGCTRTGLEICLFALGLDRDADATHALLRVDVLALRAKRFEILEQLDLEFSSRRLRLYMPNFAFSLALGNFQQLENNRGLEESVAAVSAGDIKSKKFPGPTCSVELVRAILLFPIALRALVSKFENSKFDWVPLFVNLTEPASRHPAVARIADAYAEHSANLWKFETTQAWLFACARRAAALSQELAAWRRARAGEKFGIWENYRNVVSAEFRSNGNEFVLPKFILENDEDLIRVYGNGLRGRNFQVEIPPNISLDSNAVLVFLQSLMPWGRVDLAGTAAAPVTLGGVFDGISDRLGFGAESSGSDSELHLD